MPSSHFSRRSFLKSALAAGAAPLLLPSHVWSAETPPNSRVNLGFIGCGIQSRGLLGGFLRKKETQTVAVCDVDTTRRDNHKKLVEEHYAKAGNAEGYKGCATFNDFRELLARKDIDAVVIATPDHWHAIIAIAAAAAGKDVYCEKPLTHNIHEAKALIAAIRQHGRVLQTGSQQRSSQEFRVACELVRNGVLGKISRIETAFGAPGKACDLPAQPVEPGLDWDMWLGPAPQREYHEILSPRGVHKHFPLWREYNEYGGGYVTDWGAHHVDIAQWALDMDASGPREVIPPENAQKAKAGARLIYANGVEVVHREGNGVTVFGDAGELHVNRGKFRLKIGDAEKARSMNKEDKPSLGEQLNAVEKEFLADAKVRLYKSQDHFGDFLGAMKSRKPPICDVEIGGRSIIACHLMNIAYLHGQKFQWDPAKNEFAGGTGDPKWLTREYRGAWRVATGSLLAQSGHA